LCLIRGKKGRLSAGGRGSGQKNEKKRSPRCRENLGFEKGEEKESAGSPRRKKKAARCDLGGGGDDINDETRGGERRTAPDRKGAQTPSGGPREEPWS